MSVPNTENFSLLDIITEIGGGVNSLSDCFNNANAGGFDPTYDNDSYAPANSMLRFRNYQHLLPREISITQAASSSMTISEIEFSGTGSFQVVWGDGDIDSFSGNNFYSNISHNYLTQEVRNIEIRTSYIILDFNVDDQNINYINVSSLRSLSARNNNLAGYALSFENMEALNLYGNRFTSEAVNLLLNWVDRDGLSNGILNTAQQSPLAPPYGDGITAKNNLITKGWTVITD